jgi:hypothetical protein
MDLMEIGSRAKASHKHTGRSLELALNIVWLVLSAFLVLSCTIWAKPEQNSKGQRIVVAVALACLIAFLLFPVISMTDDLASGAVVADSTNYKHWIPTAQLCALVAAAVLIASSALSGAWADTGIAAQRVPHRQAFSFHLRRRPPPIA